MPFMASNLMSLYGMGNVVRAKIENETKEGEW